MDFKKTPIVVNNFNRITTTKKMVEDLWDKGYHNIHILDNMSSYPPLLRWYEKVKDIIQVHFLDHNYIQNAIFDCGILGQFKGKYDWIAYTDSDLTLNPKLPFDFIEQFVGLAQKYDYQKVGMAIEIDDLPDTPWGNRNREWEERFWTAKLEENVYDGQIDTTFSIWPPHIGLIYKALRVAGHYTCHHEPWYVDFDNLNEEEAYYLEHSHEYSTYKRSYMELKLQTA